MGNTLCKNRVNHSNNSKSPVDRIIDRCAQICPKSIGKQKHFWDKQVLETSPPLQTQPKADNSGWHSAALTVPDSPGSQPVAPPRKKRPSMLRKDDPPLRNGFKEIFAGQRSESTTTSDSQGDVKDFTDFEKMPLNRGSEKEKEKKEQLTDSSRSSEERSDQCDSNTNSLVHKVSKVGNKKSDKFFGENLSDCLSDEPVVESNGDKLSTTDQPKADSEADAGSLDEKELAIKKELIASLSTLKDIKKDEGIDEPDRVAVEEPIISKKIITRHVCDDEEELREHLHHHHDHDHDHDHDHTYVVPDPNAPKKPQRDFSKYKRAPGDPKSDTEDNDEAIIEPSSDLLSQIQKEFPALNQILTPKEKNQEGEKTLDNKTSKTQGENAKDIGERKPSEEKREAIKVESQTPAVVPDKLSKSEQVLRRQLSSQSYLTPDLVEKIAQQVSMAHDYLPEDYSSYNDGSEIAPNSKLQQKRSLSTQNSQVDLVKNANDAKESVEKVANNLEEILQTTPLVEANKNDTELEAKISPEKVEVPKEIKVKKRVSYQIKDESPSEDISKAIKSFMEKDGLKPEDILLLLEDEFGELLHSSTLPVEDRKIIEDLRNIVDSKLEQLEVEKSKEHTPEPEPVAHLVVPENTESSKEILLDSDNTSKTENKSEQTVNPTTVTILPLNITRTVSDEKRRHSIDEFDHWFAGGLSRKAEIPERKRRREASLPGYLSSDFDIEEHRVSGELEIGSDEEIRIDKTTEEPEVSKGDHEPTVITTTAVHRIESIPENEVTTKPEAQAITPPITDAIETEKSEVTNVITERKTNQDAPAFDFERGDDKRKSVGHSLLLKFLDVERNSSYQ
ncbi:stress response protein NST1-like isoform X1 [Hermetia illucens]|nr:stress response protein NST1-like isoform X1 [Hermetia illucens]XP_037923430.1 stress response protein NST1-like isoform X1 [Hermetia illucens]XP_037923431.1 stress response protein NST1-like isoform X1 [Hermetia illucens]XP_037923432.1 stress response protein NST1-like isoform X1 [Hermetia illucens]